MAQSRQLAAIMFADIVGYTALMQEDERRALLLREKMKQKLDTEIKLHNGRLIKFSGDGALCSFDSAGESVRAAISLQLHMQQDPKVPMRVGIHQADTIFEEADVFGDSVNIASRLESMAVPGSIFISAKVFDDIKNQHDIQAASLGQYLLKNVKEPIEIYAVSNPGLVVPHNIKLIGKGVKYKSTRSLKIKVRNLAILITAITALAFSWVSFLNPYLKKQEARNVLIPRIKQMSNEIFFVPTEVFDMAIAANKLIPDDSILKKLWPTVTSSVTFETSPSGAEVYWKDYDKPDAEWRKAGITPIKDVPFPRTYIRMEIKKPGFQTIEYAGPPVFSRLGTDIKLLKLDSIGALPENMVRIPANETRMNIVGLESKGPRNVGEFLIDKFEVSNDKYKEFMDAGGYTNKSYWNIPIYADGILISLETAMRKFVDRTDRPGPAYWEGGSYPNGQENYPVTGISWYEAAAYAVYAHKKLPTVFHWSSIAETSRTENIVPLSNFSNKGPSPVGSLPGYNSFGVYDVAGNAREWCLNESANHSQRFILGGGWNDQTYAFNDGYVQNAMDRSISNGFRCMIPLESDTSLAGLSTPLINDFRDYTKEKPVDDKTFAFFLSQYSYDKTALNAHIDTVYENESWTAQKISFDAAYNNERMIAYLYLPKKFKPPYQTILFFGGSNDIFSRKLDVNRIWFIDFLLNNGRAIIRPIVKGTNERFDALKNDLQNESVFYKEHVIMWRKDLGRTLDYLESRKDIQSDKIGYFGWSWGGFMGGIMPAVEKRFKSVVLHVGGMEMSRALPEADQLNFLPRVTQPVLMLNGEHDMFFPEKSSQLPMFNFLGTPPADKKIIIYKSGHLVPRTELIKETLSWFDKYIGPVTSGALQ